MKRGNQGNSRPSMFLRRAMAILLLGCAVAASAVPGAAGSAGASAIPLDTVNKAAPVNLQAAGSNSPSDSTLAQSILNQLLVVAPAAHASRFASWPPKLDVISSETTDTRFQGVGKYNAFASAEDCIPWIRITDGLIHDVVEGDPDRLALVCMSELTRDASSTACPALALSAAENATWFVAALPFFWSASCRSFFT